MRRERDRCPPLILFWAWEWFIGVQMQNTEPSYFLEQKTNLSSQTVQGFEKPERHLENAPDALHVTHEPDLAHQLQRQATTPESFKGANPIMVNTCLRY